MNYWEQWDNIDKVIRLKSFNELKDALNKWSGKDKGYIKISIGGLVLSIRFHESSTDYVLKHLLADDAGNFLTEYDPKQFRILRKMDGVWIWDGKRKMEEYILKESENIYKYLYDYTKKRFEEIFK